MHKIVFPHLSSMWLRVGPFLVVMFFILLSDAILSDFVPGYIQEIVGSPLGMGLVMATSSVVGLLVDLVFPQLLRSTSVSKLALMAMFFASLFLITLLVSTWIPYVWLLVMGMAAWGIYYELDAFMTRQFVTDVAPSHSRSSVWGVVGTFRNLAYFLGPLLGAQIIWSGNRGVVIVAGVVLIVAYVFFLWMRLAQLESDDDTPHGVHLLAEIQHWVSLEHHVWPVLIMSFMAGLIDASFWTTGTVVTDVLAATHPAGGWFLSLYMLPSLFIGFIIAKWGVYQGKKRWAEVFLALGGLVLMGVNLVDSLWWVLSVVLLSSALFGMSWPLVDAVYSDFMARMGKRGRKHMVGMSSAMLSLAYVIGPILAGWLAGVVGELASFGWIGGLTFVVSLLLLMVTPRKIHLPQREMEGWDLP